MYWPVRLASILAAVGGCFLLDALARGVDDYARRLIVLAGIWVILSVSLNLINGITGQFSIGHAAFWQVGAYTAGYLSVTFHGKWGIDGLPWMILMMALGALMAAVAGLIVGLPSLRLRGDYLAIVTLGFGEIIRIVVQNQKPLGEAYGMNVQPKFQTVWLVWLMAIVCIAVCRNLLRTAHGLPFLAVREDEVAAGAMGVNVTQVKVTAFLIGSAFAGVAGALLAHYEGFISPQMFKMEQSFIILTMVVLGGTGSITGATIAAVALFYLPERLRDAPPVTGAALLGGLIGTIVAVVLVKRTVDRFHGPKIGAATRYIGSVVAGIVLSLALGAGFGMIPKLASQSFEAEKLRMVIFAGVLIILMLIRPQGILGTNEFSLDWVKSLLRKRKAVEA
ncbi:MAG: branched-chain amino acid ABC transporter permease [Fimbriimonadaceae bacterium]|nr:branched-chain amino acid ABC transporter permease [Fimbriimonadaceae bacterium]